MYTKKVSFKLSKEESKLVKAASDADPFACDLTIVLPTGEVFAVAKIRWLSSSGGQRRTNFEILSY